MFNVITGWPNQVIGHLQQAVSRSIQTPQITEFYLGRTVDVIATRWRHGCDVIFPLYETASADNAMIVEAILLSRFGNHPKCSNLVMHCGGGVSDEYIQSVYIALWQK